MHLIGLGLKKCHPNIPWIADFRDPWTNIDFYKDLNLSWLADKVHHRLEKKVIGTADLVLVVSQGMKDEYTLLEPKKLELITNGYDDSDVLKSEVSMDAKFSISHIGTLNAARNPKTLWKVLNTICLENENFKSDLQIQLVGKVDFSVLEDIRQLGLQEQLLKIDYLTHTEAIAKQQSSQLLLLLINQSDNAKGILTGKFFEYLAAKRPILGIGPSDGDAAAVLTDTGAGVMVDFEDEFSTKSAILNYYSQYKSISLSVESKSVERFSRRNLTQDLVNLLNEL
jgi:glycosyltransferase involved in cell wall biosynthesis